MPPPADPAAVEEMQRHLARIGTSWPGAEQNPYVRDHLNCHGPEPAALFAAGCCVLSEVTALDCAAAESRCEGRDPFCGEERDGLVDRAADVYATMSWVYRGGNAHCAGFIEHDDARLIVVSAYATWVLERSSEGSA